MLWSVIQTQVGIAKSGHYEAVIGFTECNRYAFYDKKKEEYLAQYGDPYGIFEGDTTEKNRPNIKQFIKLPKDYNTDNGDE